MHGVLTKMISRERTDKKKSYRWCMVPSCSSTSVSTPDKYFVSVPKAKKTRPAWLKAVKRDALDKMPSAKSTMYCCQDHFNMEEDMENFMRFKMIGGYLQAKANVVPHIFKKTNSPKNLSKKLDQQSLGDFSKKYCIVEFEKTGDIAAVPHVWIKNLSDNNLCFWPTKSVLFAIKSCKEPNLTSWSSHRVKILHSFDTYEEARKAEQVASFDLNFHSKPENELGRGKRKKIQKRLSCSDDDSDSVIFTSKHKTKKKIAGVQHETSTKAAEVAVKLNTKIISINGDKNTIQESSTEKNEKEKTPEIIISEDTYEEARKAEQVASFDLNFHSKPENELGRGKRKKIQKRLSCSDDDSDSVIFTSKHKTKKKIAGVQHETSTKAAEVAVKLNTKIISINGDKNTIQESSTEKNEKEKTPEIIISEGTLQEKTSAEASAEKNNVMENIQSKANENSLHEDSHVDSRIENFLDEIHDDSIIEIDDSIIENEENEVNNDSILENRLDQIQITLASKNMKDQIHENSISEHRREETHACCSCKDMLAKVIQELKALRNEFNNFSLQLKSSNEFRRPTVTSLTVIGDGLNFEFPLKSFFDLDALEKQLRNCPQKKKKLVENMILIGGVNPNDAIKRLLKGLFSDDLAQIISWEGRNGKHQLKELFVMDNLFVAIQSMFGESCPDAEPRNIKYRLREWLRLACSRQLRRKKRQENSISLFSLSEKSTNLSDDEMNDFQVYAETSNSSINHGERRSRFKDKSSYYEPRLVISDVQSQRNNDDIEIIDPVIKIENV